MTYKPIQSKFLEGATELKMVLWSDTAGFPGKVPTKVLTLALLERAGKYEGPGSSSSTAWNVVGQEFYPEEMLVQACVAYHDRLHSREPGRPSRLAPIGFIDSLPNADGSPVRGPMATVATVSSLGPDVLKKMRADFNSGNLTVAGIGSRGSSADEAGVLFDALREQSWLEAAVDLDKELQKGGEWLGAARNWMQCKVPRGDTLTWGSGEAVSIPFCKLEELALVTAKAAVLADRKARRSRIEKLKAVVLLKIGIYGRQCRDEPTAAKEMDTMAGIVSLLERL